ncbi:MAG: inositol-3-phosphate synthase, partial [Nitrososphaera sp.]
MSKKIKVALAGIGNCASALVQGTKYYDTSSNGKSNDSIGLTAFNIGGYEPKDIEFVAAFDVIDSKVEKDLSEAIFAEPNNTVKIANVEKSNVIVQKGDVLDGLGTHYREKVQVSDKPTANVAKVLKDSGAEILLNYLPVGSRQGTRYYAEACLDAGCAFINAIPVFIASNSKWQQAFQDRKLPCAGDDVMSQLGATVVHKTLVKLFVDRGVALDQTYQLNIGGDMDFYNMLDAERLEDKRV